MECCESDKTLKRPERTKLKEPEMSILDCHLNGEVLRGSAVFNLSSPVELRMAFDIIRKKSCHSSLKQIP